MGMGMGMGWPRAGRGAFTMIELIVTIGIIMILIGLMMPALGNARIQASRIKDLASMRGSMMALTQYTEDNESLFPVEDASPVWAARWWFRALLQDGQIGQRSDLGITDPNNPDFVLIALSPTAFVDSTIFEPDRGLHLYEQPTSSNRATSITFASEKAILWQFLIHSPRIGTIEWCCLPDHEDAPVAFWDGSAVIANYQQFDVVPMPHMWNRIGVPVESTWHGLSGRDAYNP